MSAAPATWPEIVAAMVAWKGVLLERLRHVTAIDVTVPPGHNYPAVVAAVEPEFRQLGYRAEEFVATGMADSARAGDRPDRDGRAGAADREPRVRGGRERLAERPAGARRRTGLPVHDTGRPMRAGGRHGRCASG